jgi:hypothetical protein
LVDLIANSWEHCIVHGICDASDVGTDGQGSIDGFDGLDFQVGVKGFRYGLLQLGKGCRRLGCCSRVGFRLCISLVSVRTAGVELGRFAAYPDRLLEFSPLPMVPSFLILHPSVQVILIDRVKQPWNRIFNESTPN